jgi:hypothetical protein
MTIETLFYRKRCLFPECKMNLAAIDELELELNANENTNWNYFIFASKRGNVTKFYSADATKKLNS